MNCSLLLPLLCAFLVCLPCLDSKPVSGRLLLILLDGFRYDYLNQTGVPLPGFDKMAAQGAKANGFVPEFPSLSFPNYYSIMTGLHPESHGQTDNYMYDVTRNESFLIGTNPEHLNPHWWNDGDPIWTTAVRQNKKVHMYYWPSCDVAIRNVRPTECLQYKQSPTFPELVSAINESLQNFKAGNVDTAAIYFEMTDQVGHKYGPFSNELNKVIRDLDPIVSDLVDRLREPGLTDVNLLVFSDHGMTQTGRERTINISTVLDPSEYIVIMDAYAIVNIYTRPGQEQQVYEKLRGFHPNMTVYLKSDLPERWHFKRGRYVAPVTAVADNGWMIITPYIQNRTDLYLGFHGYDPQINRDMQGIFLAVGPAFKKGARVETLRTVDLYNAMCQILDVQPSANNGTLANVASLLTGVQEAGRASSTLAWPLMLMVSLPLSLPVL